MFHIPDGLDDYGDDFTSFAALGDIVTSDMWHQAEVEAERARQTGVPGEPAIGTKDEDGGTEERRLTATSEEVMGLVEAEPGHGTESPEPWPSGDTDTVELHSIGGDGAAAATEVPDNFKGTGVVRGEAGASLVQMVDWRLTDGARCCDSARSKKNTAYFSK